MQYMLLLYSDIAHWAKMTPDDQKKGMGAYQAFTEALHKAGVHQASSRLRPTSDATTVRVANDKTQVLNGPYVETKEQLAGYYLIDVPDLDAAISWAARCPGAFQGTVEIRPLWPSQPS